MMEAFTMWRSHVYWTLIITLYTICERQSDAYVIKARDKTDHYEKKRDELQKKDSSLATGSNLTLSDAEQFVNLYLMKQKTSELNTTADAPLASQHFFYTKALIENSTVFNLIRRMPKGAALHLHDSGIVSAEWVVSNLTYWNNLYFCTSNSSGKFLPIFRFYALNHKPGIENCEWQNLQKVRAAMNGSELKSFDEWLYESLTMVTDEPDKAYPTQRAAWSKFQQCFGTGYGLIGYAPAFRAYVQQMLTEMLEDGLLYMEMRSVISILAAQIYESDGSGHDVNWLVQTLQNVTREFVSAHPGFLGMKVINTMPRFVSVDDVLAAVKLTVQLTSDYPGFVVGFDLVGHEDAGYPLIYYIDALLPFAGTIRYFFHAGETNTFGSKVDDNLFDAVLLNSSRLGHGYSLTKHEELMKMAIHKDMAIEVNPISNQVLGLVRDLRNHPAAELYNRGVPMVISSDDPGLWGAKALSYDFYEACMGFSGNHSDLRFLKQLAMNSVRYSAMADEEKFNALTLWQNDWDKFIQKMVDEITVSKDLGH